MYNTSKVDSRPHMLTVSLGFIKLAGGAQGPMCLRTQMINFQPWNGVWVGTGPEDLASECIIIGGIAQVLGTGNNLPIS
jgi:hypothetical protein